MFLHRFSIKLTIFSTILFLISIKKIVRSFSKRDTLEDIIEQGDERDKYIALKTSHKTLQILKGINFTFTILFMVGYAITKNKRYPV